MNLARLRPRRFVLVVACLPLLLIATTGCLANGTGLIGTPGAPTETGSSRLPSLLQQLQGSGGAGLEVFGTPQSQVLAAQDVEGKDAGPTNFGTPITTATTATTATSTVAGAPTSGPATPTPARPNQVATSTTQPGASTPTPQPATPTPSATNTPSATATPSTPTATPIPPTATPTPCTSHTEGNSCATPPPEGG